MARKHGFRGTPIRPAPTPSTVGRVFEQRGDPMVSAREGREKFGRNLETENPDFDRYFTTTEERRIAAQILKPSQVAKQSEYRKALVPVISAQQKATNILMRARKRIAAHTVDVKEKKGKNTEPCPPDNLVRSEREKQTPINAPHKSYIDFSGKNPKREIIKNGKVYRRK